MNPETTNRTTEDTNVDEKKVLSRATVTTTESSGAYWLTYSGAENIKYQKSGTNNYMIDGYFNQLFGGVPFGEMYPLNCKILNLSTYKMAYEGLATEDSTVDPSGNYIDITYRFLYVGAAGFYTFNANRILYSTSITRDSVW